jgi:hypothetical protein
MTAAVTQTISPGGSASSEIGHPLVNLWGSLPEVSQVRAPVAILKEQGQVLAQATKGLLYADARITADGSGFIVEMRIVAPTLNHYTYEILNVRHDIALYPARIWADTEAIECHDQAAFEAAVAKVLQSDRVRRAISGLLAQIQAT